MSGETQSHSRKRRDRKKKKGDSDQDKFDVKGALDVYDEDDSCKDDVDEHEAIGKSHHDDHSHGAPGSFLSTVIFFILLGGLVILTSMIFLELKGSKEVGPPISESRYASILGDFVEERTHDDDDHDVPQMYTDDEEHGNEEDLESVHFHGGGEDDESAHEQLESIINTPPTSAEAEVQDEEKTTEHVGDGNTETSIPDDGQLEGPQPELGIIEEDEHESRTEVELDIDNEEHEERAEIERHQDGAEIKQEIEREAQEIEQEDQEIEQEEQEQQEIEKDMADTLTSEDDHVDEQEEIEPQTQMEESPSEVEEKMDSQQVVLEDLSSLHSEDEEENRVHEEQNDIEETIEMQQLAPESKTDDITDPYEYEFEEELDTADVQLENDPSFF